MLRPRYRFILPMLAGCALPAIADAQMVDYGTLAEAMGEPVTTSVTGMPQRGSQAPASLVIITRDEIARSPARDVPGLLTAYAGVEVNRWTAGQSDVAVRGGVQTYNARLLVLVNGRQVYLDHYGMTDWNLLGIQLGEIQQIELVRGPASALYGFNAASGVVNIITVDPLTRLSVSGDAEAGTKGYGRISATASVPVTDAIGVRLSAGHQREHERAVPAAVLAPGIRNVEADSIGGSLVVKPDSRLRLELSASHAFNRQLELLPSQVLTIQHFRNDTVGLKADQDTDWGSISGNVYVNRLDAIYGTNGFGSISTVDLDNQIFVGSLSGLIRLDGANTLRIGAEYRNNRLEAPGTQFSRQIGYDLAAASGSLDLHPSDIVSISLAGRVDQLRLRQRGALILPSANNAADFDRTVTSASFNAAVQLTVGPQTQLRINGGRGVQSPSLVDFGLRLRTLTPVPTPYPVFVVGDPSIDPSVIWSAEASLSQKIPGNVGLEAGIFYNQVDHAIGSPGAGTLPELGSIGGPSFLYRFADAGSFESFGGEITLSGASGPFHWQTNYSWVHTSQHVAFPEYALTPRDTTPQHTINVSLAYDADHWLASGTARYTSRTRQLGYTPAGTLDLFSADGAVGMDLKLGWRPGPGLLLYVAGQNLGRAWGVAGSPIPADRRLRVGLTFSL